MTPSATGSPGRGLFVVFEGGDAVGKTTQMKLLVSWLEGQGFSPLATRQPGGTRVGAELRRVLLDPTYAELTPRAEALIYAADKAQHVAEEIRPALAAGRVVVCDRYVDSMIAYQGAGRAMDLDEVAELAVWATGGLRPDLTILLDADPAVALARQPDRDRLESAGPDFHRRTRDHLLHLADQDRQRYLVLDACKPRDAVAREVIAGLRPLLPRRP
ncbi:MAG: dTMP kinase [Propionibacteriaceae bacterium]|nr:dTMP kinase [Propionibacteriaceae bacterium]